MNEPDSAAAAATPSVVDYARRDEMPLMGSDLVNGPNPWLPAYGFQIQHHHATLQATHEDLRADDTMLVQQVDFLETILEETSDDLQSDSDRSGTTYWLGSDSETESVIHIKANQRTTADDRLDGSGSECNSVVPKKRRRKNDNELLEGTTVFGEESAMSPRSSSGSSRSSRSSSLLQFESLERTCATLSPSSYSFDSLEYSNRSNLSRLETTSPDSLEQDYERVVPNGLSASPGDFPRVRPYRSFESLDSAVRKEETVIANGFVPSLFSKRSSDLSKRRKSATRRRKSRNVWRTEDDEDEDEDDYEEDEEDLGDEEALGVSRAVDFERFEDQLLVFGDPSSNYATLDCRNTIDLREIGLETRQDAFLELKKPCQTAMPTSQRLHQAKLNIVGSMSAEPHHPHHHYHHHLQQPVQQGWSDEAGFNFRFMDKCQSAPSLALGVSESSSQFCSSRASCHFGSYTRVASVPVYLNLCGRENAVSDVAMADTMTIGTEKEGLSENRTVRTQDSHGTTRSQVIAIAEPPACEEEDEPSVAELEEKPVVTSTVKTQDHRIDAVLEMAALAMESDMDEAMRDWRREVEGAKVARTESGRSFRRAKNNASYELAQQFEVNENNLRGENIIGETTSGARKKVLNTASYELAQQCDYMRALQSRPFQRMDACDELDESGSLSHRTRESCTSSATNIASPECAFDGRVYSRSTENVSRPGRKEPDGLFSQIKKNSDLFSPYGEDGNALPPRQPVDEEVDFACLETKPIEQPASEGTPREEERETDAETSRCGEAGDRLWRVVVEKQQQHRLEQLERFEEESKQKKKKSKAKAGKKKEKKSEALERGHVVQAAGSSPPVGAPLQERHGSGNPTVAAVAVNTNQRADEGDAGDKRHAANDSPVRKEMSAVAAKRLAMLSATNDAAAASTTATTPERKKSGLGGFLQRFSRLRFSGRSKVPRSEVQKKSEQPTQVNRGRVCADEQQIKKKEPDYIIIPLHAPEDEKRKEDESEPRRTNDVERSHSNVSSTNGRPPVCSKPPLPPQPPRAGALAGRPAAGASASRRRAVTDLGNPTAIEMAKARTMQAYQDRPAGLLETDLDAAEEGADPTPSANGGKKTRSLLNLNQTARPRGAADLANENALHVPQSPVGAGHRTSNDASCVGNINSRPHKSMEFLLDKENLHFVKPPENELQKVGERVPSEHELRVQRSLQRLNVPDWYKNSPAARDGFRLKRHSDASQHSGWRALGSKTTSLSSLSSSSNRQPTTGTLLSPSPTPPVFSRWSTSLLNSAGSSPASSARSSFNHRQPYLGWRSQERLTNPRTPAERLAQGMLLQLQSSNKQQQQQQHQNQQQTTNQQLEVRNSIKEVTSAIVHYVQSGQEVVGGGGRLSPRPRPDDWDDRGGARSTSPRGSAKLCWMESSFVGSRPVDSPETPMSLATETECCASCNATGSGSCNCVDSAASALCLDLTQRDDEGTQQRGLSGLCLSPASTYHQKHHRQPHYHHHHHHHHQQQRYHRGSGQSNTGEAMATAALLRNKPSPGSTTLEDVLDSLLGLPSASRTPSPGPGPISGSTSVRHRSNVNETNAGKSCSDLRQDLQESARSVMDISGHEERGSRYAGELVRRKSEGSDSIPSRTSLRCSSQLRQRRVSFDNAQENGGTQNATEKVVRCRNNKCNNATSLAEAKKSYKSCHNCTCLYCSRDCRRAHWQRHRKTCLHSRAGTLCRQVLSTAKEDSTTLKHISSMAKRGFASHGRGAVKCFFSSPEAAEKFVTCGFLELGETTYVRWSDIQPSEMGALYSEFMNLCESYDPDTRLVLYVAVCVVSEVPTSGAVKWERQLVSRCAKMRLDASCRQPSSTASPSRQQTSSPCNITREMDSPETLVLTSQPGNNGQNTPRRVREISFSNIQRQLRLRGVSLRRHFPQVYKKLCSYVDGSVDKFAPVTIYPRDQASGKSFMCIIMLDAEPERLQLLPTDSSRVKTVDISIEEK